MAAGGVHQLAQCITCHAWNADLSMVAVCPNSSEVHIYSASPSPTAVWERIHVLQKHDQLVSGVDWAPMSNKIVTASHDRNSAYEAECHRARERALTVEDMCGRLKAMNGSQYSSSYASTVLPSQSTGVREIIQVDLHVTSENKFAVGSGAKTVCVCYYEEDNNWWVSKLIRKKHNSTVTSVAWHPNNVLLATTSTDCKCRVFSAYIKGVDARRDSTTAFGDVKFGEQLIQLDLACGWAFGVRWSPSGKNLAYVGHDSTIHFVSDVGPTPRAHSLSLRHLPLRDVLFLSDTRLVAGGFDRNPMLFEMDKNGVWEFVTLLDEEKSSSENPKADNLAGLAFAAAKGKFKWLRSEADEPSNAPATLHDNCILTIAPLVPLAEKMQGKTVTRFSTSGMDGKIVMWDMGNLGDAMSRLSI